MSIYTLTFDAKTIKQHSHVPQTGRGRALYTVAQFSLGSAPYLNYDNRLITIKEISHVNA